MSEYVDSTQLVFVHTETFVSIPLFRRTPKASVLKHLYTLLCGTNLVNADKSRRFKLIKIFLLILVANLILYQLRTCLADQYFFPIRLDRISDQMRGGVHKGGTHPSNLELVSEPTPRVLKMDTSSLQHLLYGSSLYSVVTFFFSISASLRSEESTSQRVSGGSISRFSRPLERPRSLMELSEVENWTARSRDTLLLGCHTLYSS